MQAAVGKLRLFREKIRRLFLSPARKNEKNVKQKEERERSERTV
jgi:hypothetical protein